MKKLFSMLLVLSMIISAIPMVVSADEIAGSTKSWDYTTEDADAVVEEVVDNGHNEGFDADNKYLSVVNPNGAVTLTNKYMAANHTVNNTSTYIVTLMVKDNGSTAANVTISMGDGVSKALSTAPWTETVGNYTFYNFFGTNALTGATDTFKITVPAGSNLLIDDIYVRDYAAQGTFANTFVPASGDFDNLVRGGGCDNEIPADVPDITAQKLTDFGWNQSFIEDGNKYGRLDAVTEITSTEAYEGKSSMHIKVNTYGQKFGNKDGSQNQVVYAWYTLNLAADTWHELSFYAKIVKDESTTLLYKDSDGDGNFDTNVSLGAYVGKWDGAARVQNYKYFTAEPVEGTDWVKYTSVPMQCNSTSAANRNLRFMMAGKAANVDVYIDNVVVRTLTTDSAGVAPGATGYVKTYATGWEGTNRMNAAASTFEVATEDEYTVGAAKLFDVEYYELNALSADLSNATVTAAAAVTNYTMEQPMDAQLIVCLYNGGVLDRIEMSEVESIAKDDSAVILKKALTMPGFQAIGDRTIRVFVWDSINGMVPLADDASFAAAAN